MHKSPHLGIVLLSFCCLQLFVLCGQSQISSAAETPSSKPVTGNVSIPISKETTYFTGPIRPDGTLDYVSALNRRFGRGVTQDNNAAVLLIKAFGPGFIGPQILKEVTRRLGLGAMPETGGYFVGLEVFIADKDEREEKIDEATKAPWSPEQYPKLAKWLEANRRPLELVTEASKCSRYFLPIVLDQKCIGLVGYDEPDLNTFRWFGRALVARAMLSLDSGDINNAMGDLLAAHRLGRLIGQSPTVIHALVAISIDAMASDGDYGLAKSKRLSTVQAKSYLRELQILQPLPDIVEMHDVFERCFHLEFVMLLFRLGPGTLDEILRNELKVSAEWMENNIPDTAELNAVRKAIDWGQMCEYVNAWDNRVVEAYSKKTYAQRLTALADYDKHLNKLKETSAKSLAEFSPTEADFDRLFSFCLGSVLLHSKNGLAVEKNMNVTEETAKLLITLYNYDYAKLNKFLAWAQVRSDISKVALGLAAYWAENDRYPESLASLTPKYITKVPIDLFAEESLKYSRRKEGYILYSIGANRKDDGGRTVDDDKDDEFGFDDIVVSVE